LVGPASAAETDVNPLYNDNLTAATGDTRSGIHLPMFEIRPATSADQAQIIALIDRVLQEYNDRICLDDAEADLCDIESSFFGLGGAFWVATAEAAEASPIIIGSHAALPSGEQPTVCNLKRLYVEKPYRGTPVGKELMNVATAWAIEKGFQRIEFGLIRDSSALTVFFKEWASFDPASSAR
jgi:GNAT superfamily N-acetyltransferase